MSQSVKPKNRQYTPEFKLQILREIEAGKPMAQVCRENQIHVNTIQWWRRAHRQSGAQAFASNGRSPSSSADESRIAELERMIGQLAMENAFLKKALARLEEETVSLRSSGGKR